MEKEELDNIIESLENKNSAEKAFFGVNSLEHGDEAYIKANKQGLELFAAELLKSSRDFDKIIADKEKNVISFDPKTEWLTGNIWLGYIEPKNEDRIDIVPEHYKKTWKDKFALFVFYFIAGLLILIFISGLKTIGTEIINWFQK